MISLVNLRNDTNLTINLGQLPMEGIKIKFTSIVSVQIENLIITKTIN
jgi:hypothetical protein